MASTPPSPSLDEKTHDKLGHHVEVGTEEVDTAAELLAGTTGALDPAEAERVK